MVSFPGIVQTPPSQSVRSRAPSTEEIRERHLETARELDNDIEAVQQEFADMSVTGNPSQQVTTVYYIA